MAMDAYEIENMIKAALPDAVVARSACKASDETMSVRSASFTPASANRAPLPLAAGTSRTLPPAFQVRLMAR